MAHEPIDSAADHPDFEAILQKARAAMGKGMFSEAEDLCRKVLNVRDDSSAANSILGAILARKGEPEEAIVCFERVLESSPNEFDALEWLANLKRDCGRTEEAVRLCLQMLRIRPDLARPYMALGLCYLEGGKADEGLPFLDRAVKMNPNSAIFHHNLARGLTLAQKPDEAIRELRTAISLAPDVPNSYLALGKIFFEQKKLADSIVCFRKAAEKWPSAFAYTQLANVLAEADRHDEAHEFLQLAVALDPNAETYMAIGKRQQDLGLFDEAITNFETAIRLAPGDSAAYFGITQCKKLLECDLPMLSRMEKLAEDTGRSTEDLCLLQYGLAKGYDDLGSYKVAMARYDDANSLAKQVHLTGKPFSKESYRQQTDQTISTFTSEFLSANRDIGDQSELPILIVGMIRSGTTLQEQILSSHPKVAPAGELRFWTDPQASRVLQSLFRGSVDSPALAELAESYRGLLRSYAQKQPRAIDKMPLNYWQLGLVHLLFPNAHIIHCRRNPVDTCISIYTTPYGTGADFCYDKQNIVDAYEEYLRLMTHWRSVLPADRFMEVDYEDVVADRSKVLRQVVSFCGLEWDDALLNHEANNRTVRTPSRWQVRQPIYSSSVDRWRKYEPWLGEFRQLI